MNEPSLWLEFAKLNPARWLLYNGFCNCITCSQYRAAANAWIEQQKHPAAPGRTPDPATLAGQGK